MIHIYQSCMNDMIAHAEDGFPHEVVGILAGNRDKNEVQVVVILINERAETHNRYKVSALRLMKAERELENQGLEIVGYYHSHPNHPAQYSDYDRDHALPNMSYVILSIQDGSFQNILSWRLLDDRTAMSAEPITIVHGEKQ